MHRAVAIIMLFSLAACGSDATSPTAVTFAGTYSLQTINGSKLPYVVLQQGTTAVTITADQLTIADGGTWTESGTLQTTQNGQTTTQVGGDNGTWLRSGSSLQLNSTKNGNIAYTGAFSSNRLDLFTSGGLEVVFTR